MQSRRWLAQEDAELRRAATVGMSDAEIASVLGRSAGAISSRRALLGLKPLRPATASSLDASKETAQLPDVALTIGYAGAHDFVRPQASELLARALDRVDPQSPSTSDVIKLIRESFAAFERDR